jgi:hypothetical protein
MIFLEVLTKGKFVSKERIIKNFLAEIDTRVSNLEAEAVKEYSNLVTQISSVEETSSREEAPTPEP